MSDMLDYIADYIGVKNGLSVNNPANRQHITAVKDCLMGLG